MNFGSDEMFHRQPKHRILTKSTVAPNNGVDEHTGVVFGVPRRHVHHVRFHHHGSIPRSRRVEGRHRPVVSQPMVSTHDAEAENVTLVVEDLEALRAPCRGESRDDVDFTKGTDFTVSDDDVAALDKVLVSLGVIEATDNGPDGGDWGRDLLYDGGATLVWTDEVGMMTSDGVGNGHGAG
ncbi:hypothetical protein GQ457_12G008340 [Hibiscus cannabinus]